MPPIRLWLQSLPVSVGDDFIETRRAWRQAAAAAVRARLAAELPGVDLSAMRRGPNGKPYLPPPYERYGFNPSDSGGWCLIGLVDGADIGVDLEVRQPRPKALAVARRHFQPREIDWLEAQADTDHAFLRLWTLKEALFKAIGRGLGYGLGKACFLPGTDGRLTLIDLAGDAAPADRWTCRELEVGAGCVAAAVWSGGDRPIDLSLTGGR